MINETYEELEERVRREDEEFLKKEEARKRREFEKAYKPFKKRGRK